MYLLLTKFTALSVGPMYAYITLLRHISRSDQNPGTYNNDKNEMIVKCPSGCIYA